MSDTVRVCRCGLMEPDTRDSGKMARLQVKGSSFMLMETCIKADGKKIRPMVKVHIYITTELNT